MEGVGMKFFDVDSDYYYTLLLGWFMNKLFESNIEGCCDKLELIYIYKTDSGIAYIGKTSDLYNRLFLDTYKDFYRDKNFEDFKVAFVSSNNINDLYKTLIKELKPCFNKKKYKKFNEINLDDLELCFAPLDDFVDDMQYFIGANP